jgi:hypothetical protein
MIVNVTLGTCNQDHEFVIFDGTKPCPVCREIYEIQYLTEMVESLREGVANLEERLKYPDGEERYDRR